MYYMVIVPIPERLYSSPLLAKFCRSLHSIPNASTQQLWEYAAKEAGAEIDWPNRRLMFDDNVYLLFVIKWS